MKLPISLAYTIGLALATAAWAAPRNLEALDRGVVAVKVANGVFVGWRVLGTDPASLAFNVYRGAVKVNATPITGATNLVDPMGTAGTVYSVRAVSGGVEQAASPSVEAWASQVLKIPLQSPGADYSPSDMSVGDLDGDGDWDLVLKWDPANAKDNSQAGVTGKVYLDGLTLEGKRLWRIDLGQNIRAGAHYTQVLVADYDGDGKAEMACKTAPGTKDGSGAFLGQGPAANDDDAKSYVTADGYILTGPEYVSLFNGQTGKEMGTVNYVPARGTVSAWGDGYGNRVDRFLATNAYLGATGARGLNPSMVFQRGYYTRMALTAYDWDGKTLKQRWAFDSNNPNSATAGQGNHNLSAGDVDGDGFDEIIEGASAIDHDGKFLYSTKLGHGDAMHMSDLDPDNPGLEVWEVHEDAGVAYGHELHDARTGKILWGTNYDSDNGRGMAGDIDATSPGHEMWSSAGAGVYSCKGKQLSTTKPSVNFRVYWDGDLQDDLLDGNKVDKWTGDGTTRLITLQGSACNGTKNTPNFSGDILGDWREEVILHDATNLYLTTTTTPTSHRLYTLAHDPVYRLAMSWQNGAYNQPPHLGFWLGAGVDKAPKPDLYNGGVSGIRTTEAQQSLVVARANSRLSLSLPWREPSVARVVSLDGQILSQVAFAGGGLVELDLPAHHGAMVLSVRSASGVILHTTLAGF